MRYCVVWLPVRSYLQVFLSLYRTNRKISKVCLQIIFVCRLETGLLAWVRKITVGKCLFRSRTGLLFLFLSAETLQSDPFSCVVMFSSMRTHNWGSSIRNFVSIFITAAFLCAFWYTAISRRFVLDNYMFLRSLIIEPNWTDIMPE